MALRGRWRFCLLGVDQLLPEFSDEVRRSCQPPPEPDRAEPHAPAVNQHALAHPSKNGGRRNVFIIDLEVSSRASESEVLIWEMHATIS